VAKCKLIRTYSAGGNFALQTAAKPLLIATLLLLTAYKKYQRERYRQEKYRNFDISLSFQYRFNIGETTSMLSIYFLFCR